MGIYPGKQADAVNQEDDNGIAREGMPRQVNYRNLILYYSSGTGNSAAVSKWMAGIAGTSGLNVISQPIDRIKKPGIPDMEGETLIGFIFPTHGFFPIWSMLKFIIKFPKSRIKDVFLATTVGGSRINRTLIPGLAGGALYVPGIILKFKRYSIRGLLTIDLPSSWTAIHPPLSSLSIREWMMYSKPKVEYFIYFLLYQEKRDHKLNFRISYLLVIPIGIVYLIGGKIFLAKTLFSSFKCKGCGLCEKRCPVSAVKMKRGRPFWTWRCESCMRCINNCPQQAIQSNIFYLVFLCWITYWYPFKKLFPIVSPVLIDRYGSLLGNIVLWLGWYVFYVLVLILLFRLLFYFLKFKPVNHLFTLSSFTRYYGRYKGPEKDFDPR